VDGPGRYERCADRTLAAALDQIVTEGYADIDFGSTNEQRGYHALVSRWIISTDPQGFVTYSEHESEPTALLAFEKLREETNG
jgi:hypothetical protein